MSARLLTRKDEIPGLGLGEFCQNGRGVDLAPFCAEHFIGARYCQDCKFQS